MNFVLGKRNEKRKRDDEGTPLVFVDLTLISILHMPGIASSFKVEISSKNRR